MFAFGKVLAACFASGVRITDQANLTVALIRQARFGDDAFLPCQDRARIDTCQRLQDDKACPDRLLHQRIDKVELNDDARTAAFGQILASDPQTPRMPLPHPDGTEPDVPQSDLPKQSLSPVVGSPALAGLGVSMIVPGTLLDVVA